MPVSGAGAARRLRVAMVLYGDLSHDSRVIREAETLAAADHDVAVACLSASTATVDRLSLAAVRVFQHQPMGGGVLPGDRSPFLSAEGPWVWRQAERVRWLWRYRSSIAQWGRAVVDAMAPVDVWHAHDLTGLEAVAPNLERSARIIYDSHELFLERWSAARLPGIARLLLRLREGRLVARCEAVITVNPGLAAELERRYHPARLEVVRNCPPRWAVPESRPNRIREALGLPAGAFVVLFHGAIVPGRGIRTLVEAMATPRLESVRLVLMGYGSLEAAIGDGRPSVGIGSRIHVLPAVAPAELAEWVASADVGAVLIEPLNRNLLLSTPNKLFESIAVGTPVIASDLPEIRRVIMGEPEGPLGILCDPARPAAAAEAIARLLDEPGDDLREMGHRCLRAADRHLNWEKEGARLLALYS